MTASTLNIALSESIAAPGQELLARYSAVHQFSSMGQLLSERQQVHTDAIIVRSTLVDAESMDRLPGLRVIGRHGAGLDNIDLGAAQQRGIQVVNTPHSNTRSVAEYVLGVVYGMLKRFGETERALRSGAFTREGGSLPGQVHRMGLAGRELSSCVLGIVGYGAIGRSVADLAEANGMSVAFYDPYLAGDLPAGSTRTRLESLDALLAVSDVLTLHVPGSAGQRPLIGAAELALMKRGSCLVNAARGSCVSLSALTDALESGQLAGAALDVYDEEPPAFGTRLLEQPNVVLTPHMAAMTEEALERMAVDVAAATIEALRRA